jgi:lysophospholipase L1-like esterase
VTTASGRHPAEWSAVATPLAGRRLARAAALVAVVMVGLSACGGDDEASDGATVPVYSGAVPQANEAIDLRPAPSGEVHDVAMVGDSITVASTDEIEKAVQSLGVDLTIRAEVGRRIGNGETPAPGTSIVDEILADDTPDLWVIALGTNDLGQFDTDEEYQAAIENLLSLIPSGTPVAWINTYVVAKPDESAQFDAALQSVLQRRGRATIGNWAVLADGDGVLSDGIHPTDDGATLFAGVVESQIEDWQQQTR